MAALSDYLDRRIPLALLPTRVERAERLERRTAPSGAGPEIWIKHDDETGTSLSGNKARKLEYLLAEARSEGADVVLTCGAVQSNHCRATALSARRLGLDSLLFLRGEKPAIADGNHLLGLLAGADCRYVSPEQYIRRADLMREAADELRSRGRRPYVIPEGGSNAVGSLGYVRAVREIASQGTWTHVVCATGSGGTLAGLALGAAIFAPSMEVWGVNVCDNAAYFEARVREIAAEFQRRFVVSESALASSTVRSLSYRVVEGYKGPAYGVPQPEVLDFIRESAREEGLFLDPVYTGKALFGLCEEVRAGRLTSGHRVLFVHTGGLYGLFPFREQLIRP